MNIICQKCDGKCWGMSVIACSSSRVMSAWLAECVINRRRRWSSASYAYVSTEISKFVPPEPNMCLPPLQVLAVAIGNCPNIKVQGKHVQTHKIMSVMDLFPLANGLESGPKLAQERVKTKVWLGCWSALMPGPSDRPHIRLLAPGLRSLGYLCSYLVESRDGWCGSSHPKKEGVLQWIIGSHPAK
jgi:hypothetical protein